MQLTIEEFKDQYVDILDLLSFILEVNLIGRLSNFFDSSTSWGTRMQLLVSAAQDLLLDTANRNRILKILGYDLVQKLMDYFGINADGISLDSIKHVIAIGLSLYDILDRWKDSYAESKLYCTAARFLNARNLLNEGDASECLLEKELA